MPKQEKDEKGERMGSPRLGNGAAASPGKGARRPRYPPSGRARCNAAAAVDSCAADGEEAGTAARPQHARRRNRSTDGQGATFSFRIRERICAAHIEAHGILRERVTAAGASEGQGTAASLEGMGAELRAVAVARRYAAEGLGPVRSARMVEVRRALLAVACSAILLAEAADRPAEEFARGEKSRARQWLTPSFKLGDE